MVLTPDALLIRLIDQDPWAVMAWRGVLNGSVLLMAVLLVRRQNPFALMTRLGVAGWAASTCMGLSSFTFIFSLSHTTAANSLVILAVMPFVSALMMWLFLQQKLPTWMWGTIALASSGIILVFWGKLGGGSLIGDLAALVTAFFLAGMFVIISANPHLDTLLVTATGAMGMGLVSFFVTTEPVLFPAQSMIFMVIEGALIIPLSFALITIGPKLITPAEVSLIMMLETVLGPFWVWLVLSEQPAFMTVVGGAVVLLAVLGHTSFSMRRSAL